MALMESFSSRIRLEIGKVAENMLCLLGTSLFREHQVRGIQKRYLGASPLVRKSIEGLRSAYLRLALGQCHRVILL